MTDHGDRTPPDFAATCWTIAKFALWCAAGFVALGAVTWLGITFWLSTAAP